MTSYVPARLLGGILCAATVFAFSAPSFAVSDEPAQLTEDVTDVEVRPPGSSEDMSEDRGSVPEEPSTEAPDRAPDRASTAPAEQPQPDRVERVDREAAKRALLSDPKKDKPNPLLDVRGPDYYDRRAKELLKVDTDKGRVDLHPLMEAHPDSYVVVCTAGCPSGESAQIVSQLPKRTATPLPAATTDGGSPEVSCIGGCGNGDSTSFASVPKSYPAGSAVAATVGEWMTTVAKAPAGAEAPAPKAAGSGEWMETINRDRDSTKVAASHQAAVNTKPAATPKASEPAPPASAEAKPAIPAAVKPAQIAEAKPIVEAKPAEIAETKKAEPVEVKTVVAETKPLAPVETKPAAPIVEVMPPAPVKATPTVTVEAKPAAAAPAPAAPSPAPQDPTAPIAKPEAKAPAPAAVTEQKPAEVTVTPPKETKVAAVEPPTVEKPAPVAPAAPKERVISVLSEDKDMNAAIEKARGSLSAFWKSYDAPAAGEADHALKVAVAGNGTTEHFWLTRIKRDGGKLSGVISNQPQSVKTVKVGQRYEFTTDMISDWTFKRNGKLVGNETMRVLLPRMPEEQASVYRQMYETP